MYYIPGHLIYAISSAFHTFEYDVVKGGPERSFIRIPTGKMTSCNVDNTLANHWMLWLFNAKKLGGIEIRMSDSLSTSDCVLIPLYFKQKAII